MKTKTIIISLILLNLRLFAQDGSDISYIDENKINADLIGKFIQIDFYNYSFGLNKYKTKNDTIKLFFQKRKYEFIEVRNDDGYNNWFSEQYLVSKGNVNGKKLRIQKMKLLNISNDSIEVKLFAHYFKNDIEIFSEFLTDTIHISRKKIYQILLHNNPSIKKGLSIYRVYHYYPDFTSKKKPKCYYCFEASEDNIYNKPLLSDYHIKYFDYEKQQIVLNELGKKVINKIDIPLQGLPVVLTLNGEIIYEFWFWNKFSSFGCDRVYTYPQLDFIIKFGLPKNNRYGEDPRYDERLKKYKKE